MGADRYYLIDVFREQCEYSALRGALRHFRKCYRPAAILIERAANGNALISDLSRKHAKLIMPIDPDGRSKSARFRVHAETIVAKRIYLPAEAPWRDDFIAEIVEFRHGKFTDQVDAMTQFLDHAGELAGLKPGPPAAQAVLARNSSGQSRTISPSTVRTGPNTAVREVALTRFDKGCGREFGIAAGTHSDGRPMTGRQANVRFPSIIGKVRYSP